MKFLLFSDMIDNATRYNWTLYWFGYNVDDQNETCNFLSKCTGRYPVQTRIVHHS